MNDNEGNAYMHEYDDYHFMEDESVLMEESTIRWAYRPGRVLLKSLYIDTDDVNIGEDVLVQFAEFHRKTKGYSWKRLYKFMKMRRELNQFKQDMRITREYMKYELSINNHSDGIIDFEWPSTSQFHLLMSLYIFKILSTYERRNFPDLIFNPQMS